MTQRQRARYRVARYIIVNNVSTATLESKTKNTWKRRWQKRNGNSLNSLYLGVLDSFKDGSSKLNNHSAMAIGKFILVLSVQFEFCFILWLFSLRFFYENDMKLNYKNWQLIFSFPWGMNEKNRCAHFRMVGYARHTMCTSVFSFIPPGNEKYQQPILKRIVSKPQWSISMKNIFLNLWKQFIRKSGAIFIFTHFVLGEPRQWHF